jgi:hypothetical protein
VLLLLLLGLILASESESSAELTAVLTQVDGVVQLAGSGVNGIPLATLWQVVRAGITIRVPVGGTVGIVCSNRRFVRLQGPVSWFLTEQTCVAGRELTPGEYALVAPQSGRFKVVHGLLTLEREIRAGEVDDPLAPVLLSPRNTLLRSPRPAVSWVRVPSAIEYRVEWSGRGVGYDTRLNVADVACATDRAGIDVCVLTWPSDRPDLAPQETAFLRLAARGGAAEPWHWTDPVEVRTQKISGAIALEGRLRDLEVLGLAEPALQVARAGLLAEEGLYSDAAEAYRSALATATSPELLVTLADVYLVTGLYQLAEPHYREALSESGPSVRAAAAFGLGRLEYTRGRYREAVVDFRQACKVYGSLGLSEERAAACKAMEKVAAVLRPRFDLAPRRLDS